MHTRSMGQPLSPGLPPTVRRPRVNHLALRTSPGPDVLPNEAVEQLGRSLLDPSLSAAAILRFEDSGRVAQPGQGRRGEQGQIFSGRVIPRYADPIIMPGRSTSWPSSRPTSSSSSTTPSGSSSPPPHGVKRILRRKGKKPVEGNTNIAAKRLLKEAQTIQDHSPPGCHAAPKADDLYEWAAVIEGPADTVYAGGTFFCSISLPKDYPFNPPKVSFQTRIYHCNINAQGEVCIDLLRDKWNATMDMATVLQSLLSLLYDCNPDDALVCPIGKQFKEDRELFDKTARLWTIRYAC